jgi:hypothetical protein
MVEGHMGYRYDKDGNAHVFAGTSPGAARVGPIRLERS